RTRFPRWVALRCAIAHFFPSASSRVALLRAEFKPTRPPRLCELVENAPRPSDRFKRRHPKALAMQADIRPPFIDILTKVLAGSLFEFLVGCFAGDVMERVWVGRSLESSQQQLIDTVQGH